MQQVAKMAGGAVASLRSAVFPLWSLYKPGRQVKLPAMTDIIIIGGGIAGVSAAATLSAHAQVTLLEGEAQLGYHASGRSAAVFLADYGNDVVRALNHASKDHHLHANDGVLSPRGMMLVARPFERDGFLREVSSVGMQEISKDEARAITPILHPENTAFIAYREDFFDLDADRLLQNYRKTALRNGAEILTNSPVGEITKTATGWRVKAGEAVYDASVLVNAAGAWVDEIAKMAGIPPLGFRALRRSMARLPAPGGHNVSGWPFLISVFERWYAKPDAGSWIVSPAEEGAMHPHDAWADDMVLAEGLARYEEMVTEPVTRLQTSWAGLRSFAPDQTLVLGADRNEPGFYWLGGQGGYGFQSAPAASTLIADLVLGRKPELPEDIVQALSPHRFSM